MASRLSSITEMFGVVHPCQSCHYVRRTSSPDGQHAEVGSQDADVDAVAMLLMAILKEKEE